MKTNQLGRILLTPYEQAKTAVSTPPAQFVKVLQSSNADSLVLDILIGIAQAGVSKFGHYALGVDLMLSGGLRISEVIAERMVLVNTFGQVLIKGRKGSRDKLVTPVYCADYWRSLQGWVFNPCSVVSRFSWYRFLRAQGVVLQEKGRKHQSVTHSARKLQAHCLYGAGVGVGSIQDVIGHRSARSTEYYLPHG